MTTLDLDTLPDDPAMLRALLRGVVIERDAVAIERDAVLVERDAVLAERGEVISQRDRIIVDRDTINAEREALLVRALKAESERDALKHQLELRLQKMFGRRTEKMDPAQLALFLDRAVDAAQAAAAEDQVITVPEHTRRGGGRKPLPADLPRQDVIHDLSDAEKACPGCGEVRVEISRTTREVLEIIPARVKIIRHIRPVYLCPTCPTPPVKAPAPALPLGKGYAGASVLALIGVSKYADHAPLYRQEGMLARAGIDLSRSTLCDWLRESAARLMPLVRLLERCIRQSGVIQHDDTPLPTLGLEEGRARPARMWASVGDRFHRYVTYQFTTTREGKWVRQWLGDFRGFLQSDAYAGYEALGDGGGIQLVGCWAHARRHFFDHRSLAPEFCRRVLGMIGRLYEIEGNIKDKPPDERAIARRDHAAPILDELLSMLKEKRTEFLPKEPLSRAIAYVLDRPDCFRRYLGDGILEIDNNACERSLRAVAIGRKNWLFAGSQFGGETAAAWFSVIASARLHEVEPWAYLTDVLTRLPRLGPEPTDADLEPLLPDRWIAEHPAAKLLVNR